MTIKRYTSADQITWDKFVKNSRNGTFLFERAYMDYHCDRFQDHSLIYLNNKSKIIAVLPACEISDGDKKILSSHAGLTFGGFVLSNDVNSVDVLELFAETKKYLKEQSFTSWTYKSIPYIYYIVPSQEDDYALWMNSAELEVCNISTTIDLYSKKNIEPDPDRSRRNRKAKEAGFIINETSDFREYWIIVEKLLKEKYNTKPVHTVEEITLLKQRFPKNIRCFVATLNGVVHGGVVIYESQTVAHAQYSEASDEGKRHGVLDMIYLHLIDYYRKQRSEIRYFDFGISNEDRGRYLNRQLIFYKEDFGGRGVTYKTYRIDIQ